MKFAYADPPYFGFGAKMYGYPEWDEKQRHIDLVTKLVDEFPDGWALSCLPKDLAWLLPACPEDTRVCAWMKTYHRYNPGVPIQYGWEAVLVRGGHPTPQKPFVRDWIAIAAPHVRGKAYPGQKPPEFCRWILELLGYDADPDELVDLFPGSGIMGAVAAQGVLV